MPDFTARTPEELALTTDMAELAKEEHSQYYETLEGRCFNAVGVSSPDCVETFLYTRLVRNKTGSKWYCMIWLYTDDAQLTIISHAVHEDSYQAQVRAFNKLLNVRDNLGHCIAAYIEAVAVLYRPDLRACRIV